MPGIHLVAQADKFISTSSQLTTMNLEKEPINMPTTTGPGTTKPDARTIASVAMPNAPPGMNISIVEVKSTQGIGKAVIGAPISRVIVGTVYSIKPYMKDMKADHERIDILSSGLSASAVMASAVTFCSGKSSLSFSTNISLSRKPKKSVPA